MKNLDKIIVRVHSTIPLRRHPKNKRLSPLNLIYKKVPVTTKRKTLLSSPTPLTKKIMDTKSYRIENNISLDKRTRD